MYDWPRELQPLFSEDVCLCLEQLHAGKCPYKEEFPVSDTMKHAQIICSKIIQIVWYYGGDTDKIPRCMPLKSDVANQIISFARKKLNITSSQLPEPFTKNTPIYYSVINRILFRNLIEPMQKRGRGYVQR